MALGYLVLPLLITSYCVGYAYKDTGVPIPGFKPVHLWQTLVKNDPQSPADLAFENYTLWTLLYCFAHFVMYVKPQRSLFHPFKLNPNYPPSGLIFKEILRSLRGVGICTFYSIIVNKLHSDGTLPTKFVPSIFDHDGDVSLIIHGLGIVLMFLWGDFHFYWTHRLLHTLGFTKVYIKPIMNLTTPIHFLVYRCTGLNQLSIFQLLLYWL